MSMVRCDRHGSWDSDQVEECPLCLINKTEAKELRETANKLDAAAPLAADAGGFATVNPAADLTFRKACPSHCCPVHGCKYGYEDCPITAGKVAPQYPHNNGCEICESEPSADPEQRRIADLRECVRMCREHARPNGLTYIYSHACLDIAFAIESRWPEIKEQK